MRVHNCEVRNWWSSLKLWRSEIIGTQWIGRAEEKVFLRVWKCAGSVCHRGVSKIIKDSCSHPENQSRECLPCNAQSWSEVVFLRMPQLSTRWGECRGRQIAHLRNRHRKRTIG